VFAYIATGHPYSECDWSAGGRKLIMMPEVAAVPTPTSRRDEAKA
jgi:hypothetical protein